MVDAGGRVVFANLDLASLFNQSVDELVGQDIFRFVDEPERAAARARPCDGQSAQAGRPPQCGE